MEALSGRTMGGPQREMVIAGPTELDLVRSALEDTMVEAYGQIREVQRAREIPDLRTAAFYLAFDASPRAILLSAFSRESGSNDCARTGILDERATVNASHLARLSTL